MRISKVTIVREHVKSHNTINDLLLLFGQSLGLFGLRDKDKSCYRIFITLVKALKVQTELSSDELAELTGLSRGTVVYHLNRLLKAGIVTNYKNKYYINYDSLEDLVKDLKRTVAEMLDDIENVAKEIDRGLHLSSSQEDTDTSSFSDQH
ncbi:MAG: ArsR family transcriptional regulator [Nanobdellota archaeon]